MCPNKRRTEAVNREDINREKERCTYITLYPT